MQRFTLVSYALASALGVSASPFNRPIRRAPASIPGYEYTGCYTEATNSRALTGSAFFHDQLTAERCATACSGFKYFGLEYGKECYCGDSLNEGSVEAAAEDCSFECPGDSAQTCGAGNRLTLYTRSDDEAPPGPTLPTTYRALGCHSEPTGTRALIAKMERAEDMTVSKCADICHTSGYPVFGLEYYNECYCGNGLTPGTAAAPEAECSFPCAGNSNEMCGGDWRINVYEFSTDVEPPTSTAPSTPSTTPALEGWNHDGCYTEGEGQRALSDVAFYDDAMTLEKCANVCDSYNWFGVEYGRECYCGNTLNAGSVPAPALECNFPCPGQPSQTCGAGNRLNLYSADDCSDDDDDDDDDNVPTTTSAPPAVTTTIAPEPSSTSSTSSAPATTTSAPPPPPPPTNQVSNGGFENGAAGWTMVKNPNPFFTYDLSATNAAHSGQFSAQLQYTASLGPNTIPAPFTLTTPLGALIPGATYDFIAWVKLSLNNNLQCGVWFNLENSNGVNVGTLGNVRPTTTNWLIVFNTWTNSGNLEGGVNLKLMSTCAIAGGHGTTWTINIDSVEFKRRTF